MLRSEAASDRIVAEVGREIDRAYARRLRPVLRRYAKTMRRIDALIADDRPGAARRLYRTSGLLDELVEALSGGGADAARLIREGQARIREAVDEDEA